MICLKVKKKRGKCREGKTDRSVSQNTIPFSCNIFFKPLKLLRWVLLNHLQLTDGETQVQKDDVISPR